ncbi:uncharacterized protein LOC102388390 isoform X2 [Alligator sinensis]|uniref:Uncharacterized protein LOC102388390 isoform X2 n=1 Tax=Alligator sinensis TaxID=38654 RepID=A0A3Q0FPH0_ALLSI|nr:uncharacterized protein LOC102388390 isoform X2 [Alligator sinensis]
MPFAALCSVGDLPWSPALLSGARGLVGTGLWALPAQHCLCPGIRVHLGPDWPHAGAGAGLGPGERCGVLRGPAAAATIKGAHVQWLSRPGAGVCAALAWALPLRGHRAGAGPGPGPGPGQSAAPWGHRARVWRGQVQLGGFSGVVGGVSRGWDLLSSPLLSMRLLLSFSCHASLSLSACLSVCLTSWPCRVSAHPLEVRAQAHEDPLSTLGQSYLEDKHSLRLESPPGVPHSDSSKKRLIEDTEDWRPRTGTTQSRSFRILAQLTGTEFMQDPDDELAKKSREKFFTELQSPRYTRLRDWHHQRSATSLHV